MVVVFGASGQTGGEVTRLLAARGVPTRALVHNPEKAGMLSGLNVEIVQADLAKEYARIGAGHPAFGVVMDTVPRLTGQAACSVDQFARDYARALASPPQQLSAG